MESVNCNLCGSSEAKIVYRVSDWLLDHPDVVTTLVQCSYCGLIYQNPRPTEVEIGQHYPDEYEPYLNFGVKKSSWLQQKSVEYGLDKRANEVLKYVKTGNLLDIGCAVGDFLNHMRGKYHWQVCGVEVSEYAAELARKRYGLDVFTGTLEEAHYPDNTFDAVTMWDVLEHLHDPSAALKEIWRVLKPGGMLVLRIPNGDSLDARVFGNCWAGLDTPRHLYLYTKATLNQLFEKNGLNLLKTHSRQGSYVGAVLSIRMWLTARKTSLPMRNGVVRFLNHPVMRLATAPVFFLYSLTGKAAEMTAAAQVKK
jgi:ubiquinone/menaquinone biosynthesis C-methylase UbiE